MARILRIVLFMGSLLIMTNCVQAPAGRPTIEEDMKSTITIETIIQPELDAHVWYLGSNGWAVRIQDKILVFDYQEFSDPSPPITGEARDLQRGYIDPEELSALDTYVFVTHSHQDHFAPVIFDWQDRIDKITYFFGWDAGNNPDHHYMVGPRASITVGDMEVFTINSNHTGIPEVAFLVDVGGFIIYHNGDYKADYLADYEYLRTLRDRIDVAFVIGVPQEDHQYFQQAFHLSELFSPRYLFPMNREGDEYKNRLFAESFTEQVSGLEIVCAEDRGDNYAIIENEIP